MVPGLESRLAAGGDGNWFSTTNIIIFQTFNKFLFFYCAPTSMYNTGMHNFYRSISMLRFVH